MTTEIDIALDRELRDALEKSANLDVLRAITVKCRGKGFDSESVNELLAAMRDDTVEDIEGRIMKIMDIVSGFCAPIMRVW
ncbi:hypothetical protein [Burkholderia ubonensis]|uniref:hypothetical protein n=1 Tax=Burkholderia ubonensis TaxID=101571 RepID=UPI002ABE9936|nr:hypothetical protein [Burkholderia ubonensis]